MLRESVNGWYEHMKKRPRGSYRNNKLFCHFVVCVCGLIHVLIERVNKLCGSLGRFHHRLRRFGEENK
jgi:hypothetical protein